jgi:putative ABC transport system substrate-binding protein
MAAELVALSPDVILSSGVTGLTALQKIHHIPDPVGAGFVDSLARPGGNVTGFMQFEYSLSAKWVELLKEIAPGVTRAAVLRDSAIAGGVGQFAMIQAVAPSVGVDVSAVNLRDAAEIERAVTAFARDANGGLILTASPMATVDRDVIAAVAIRNKLPSVGPYRSFVTGGASYLTAPILKTSSGARPAMSIVFSRAKSRRISRCRRQPSTSW